LEKLLDQIDRVLELLYGFLGLLVWFGEHRYRDAYGLRWIKDRVRACAEELLSHSEDRMHFPKERNSRAVLIKGVDARPGA